MLDPNLREVPKASDDPRADLSQFARNNKIVFAWSRVFLEDSGSKPHTWSRAAPSDQGIVQSLTQFPSRSRSQGSSRSGTEVLGS